MKFNDLKIGDRFKYGIIEFVKTDDSMWPVSIPLHRRNTNCIRIDNRHKCVMGGSFEVELVDDKGGDEMSYSLEQDWIFTFGCGQEHAGHYVKIFGTFDSARDEMIKRFGDRWCWQYSAKEYFAEPERHDEVELVIDSKVSDDDVLKLYHGMSETMQKAIVDVMTVTQLEKEKKDVTD